MTLITGQLALGNSEDASLYSDHIGAVLCCAREVPLFPQKPGHHLQLDDGQGIPAGSLEAAYAFLDEQLALGNLILVYCGQGTSRSASVLSGYLAIKSSTPIEEVLDSMRRLRPAISPTKSTFLGVKNYVAGIPMPSK